MLKYIVSIFILIISILPGKLNASIPGEDSRTLLVEKGKNLSSTEVQELKSEISSFLNSKDKFETDHELYLIYDAPIVLTSAMYKDSVEEINQFYMSIFHDSNEIIQLRGKDKIIDISEHVLIKTCLFRANLMEEIINISVEENNFELFYKYIHIGFESLLISEVYQSIYSLEKLICEPSTNEIFFEKIMDQEEKTNLINKLNQIEPQRYYKEDYNGLLFSTVGVKILTKRKEKLLECLKTNGK